MGPVSYFGRRARERELERAQREWRRRLEEDLRRLETAPGHEEVEPLEPDSERSPRYHPLRREPRHDGAPGHRHPKRNLSDRSRTYLAGLIALLVTVTVLTFDGGSGGSAFRRILGIDDRVLSAVDAEAKGRYEFFGTLAGSDQPVTWSPCQPIRYVVNPAQAPEDWADLLDEAAAEVSGASGLSLVYEGTTTDHDFTDRSGRSADQVLIGWSTAEEVPRLEGDVAGLGGPVVQTRNGRRRYVSGSIVLDADSFDRLETAPRGRAQQRAIVMHEMGHLLGLDHVEADGELMNADNVGRSDFGPGDLAGLALLGAGSCS